MPRWIGWIWIATLAVVVGVLIPRLVNAGGGGGSRSWALIGALLGIAVVVTCAVELSGRLRFTRVAGTGRRHELSEDDETPIPPVRDAAGPVSVQARTPEPVRPSAKPADGDWEALHTLVTAVSARQLAWLSSTDFSTPWFDLHARPFIELRSEVARLAEHPFPHAVAAALAELRDAATEFAAFYEHHTSPDPVLLGADWRFFEWDDPRAFGVAADGDDLSAGRARQLHALALACAQKYEALTACVLSERSASMSRSRSLQGVRLLPGRRARGG